MSETRKVKKARIETVKKNNINGIDDKINNKEVSIGNKNSFRIIVGSYEHHLACFSVIEKPTGSVFHTIFYFAPHTGPIQCMAQSKRYLVSGGNDENIKIYDLQKRKELGTMLYHDGGITSLNFFKNKWLLSSSTDGKILIWNTKDWEVIRELKGHKGRVNSLSIHYTGKIALSIGIDRKLILWNLMTGKKSSIYKLSNIRKDEPLKVTWSNSGKFYAVGYTRFITIFNSPSSDIVKDIKLNVSTLQHLMFIQGSDSESNLDLLFASFSDGSIVVYDVSAIESRDSKESSDSQDSESESESESDSDSDSDSDSKKSSEKSTETTEENLQVARIETDTNRIKHFSFLTQSDPYRLILGAVSSNGFVLIYDITDLKNIVLIGKKVLQERLNCCILVHEQVEKYETRKPLVQDKQSNSDSEADSESDSESDSEADSES